MLLLMCNVVLAAVEVRGEVMQIITPVILLTLVVCRTTEAGWPVTIKLVVIPLTDLLDPRRLLPSTLRSFLDSAGFGSIVPMAMLAFVTCPVRFCETDRPEAPAKLQRTTLVGTPSVDLDETNIIWF